MFLQMGPRRGSDRAPQIYIPLSLSLLFLFSHNSIPASMPFTHPIPWSLLYLFPFYVLKPEASRFVNGLGHDGKATRYFCVCLEEVCDVGMALSLSSLLTHERTTPRVVCCADWIYRLSASLLAIQKRECGCRGMFFFFVPCLHSSLQ